MKKLFEYSILFIIAAIMIASEPMFQPALGTRWVPLVLAGIIVVFYALVRESSMRNLFIIAGVIVAVDQWTKSLVRHLPLGGIWLPAGFDWLSPYMRIINWYNTGAAFGSFTGYGWVFTILAFVVVGLIIYYYPRVENKDWWLKLAMGMQMGGALGNVVDRLLRNGQVTDFISVGNFAVFNVADASISMGVVVLLIGAWLKDAHARKDAASHLLDDANPTPPVEAAAPESVVDAGETNAE